MRIQKSFAQRMDASSTSSKGVLYLVATPIGNLEDITFRALRILREVDLICAEDTRHTRKLLSFYEIASKLKSYHEHNKRESGRQIIEFLLAGQSVALVSDAGMPAISDPGFDLVCLALENELSVVPIPGANAALSALVVSGLPNEHFTFVGFLPRDKKGLRTTLQTWATHRHTLLFYEAPHRLQQTLRAMLEVFGDRSLAVAREMTKKHEEFWRGSVSSCLQHVAAHGVQGECCLIVEGASAVLEQGLSTENAEEVVSLSERVVRLLAQGIEEKQAIRQIAKECGVAKRIVYNEFVQTKNL